MPTFVFPSINFTESTAQLRDSIDHIQFEQVQNRESVDDLKHELTKNITGLEIALAQSTSRQEMVFSALTNDFRREVQIQKVVLTQQMTAFRLETQEGITINFQKSLPISIEGVMTKRGKIVVVVHSLKIEEDQEVVEAAVNHLRKEVDHTKEEGAEVLDLVVGFLE
ncbi:hypothetical protein F511_22272 [Dorcoceras hygrometricum]|uniref:Uncharacterized protein n=1 Tax=Dorcoceras hygrometricum TaxID=472368 RepID=A0A2Z7CDL9_9LAMI|nr:hypothetical protein F511_22272 [Dorcoceras hygrometricum]